MSYEGIQHLETQETFEAKECREVLAKDFNKDNNFNEPRIVAGEKIDRILDKFTDPNIEDNKKAKRSLITEATAVFSSVSLLVGFISGGIIWGWVAGSVALGIYLFFMFALKNG